MIKKEPKHLCKSTNRKKTHNLPIYLHYAISRIARKYCKHPEPEITYLYVEKEI